MKAKVKEEVGAEEGATGAASEQWRLLQKEVSPTWVEHGRGWRRSELFLAKLGCLGWDGELLPFHNRLRKAARISEEFKITGFHDGGEELPSMIQVNNCRALSLAPDVVGRVLGISYTGSSVPARGYASRYESVKDYLVEPRGKEHACRNGLYLKNMLPGLRHFVLAHIDRLCLPGNPAGVTVGHACAFVGALFHGEVFDWAQNRVDYLKSRLRSMHDKPLPDAAQELLLKYVSAAIPSLPEVRLPRNVGVGERETAVGVGKKRRRDPNSKEWPTRWSRRLYDSASQTSTKDFDVKSGVSPHCRGPAPAMKCGNVGCKRKAREDGSSDAEAGKELKKARAELAEVGRDLEMVKMELQAKEESMRAMEKEHDRTIAAMRTIIDGYAALWCRPGAGK